MLDGYHLTGSGNTLDDRYVNVTGDTMTGLLYIDRSSNNIPSLKWNKGGSYYGGIGYGGTTNYNVFGPVNENNTWSSDYSKDIWEFRGTILNTKNIISSDFKRLYSLGTYTAQGNVIGSIKIKIPQILSHYEMLYIRICIYEYSSYGGSEIIIGGHNWNSGWYNSTYTIIGNYDKGVRTAIDSTNYCILLGNTSTVWSYPAVHIDFIGCLYSSYSSDWLNSIEISLITDETGITNKLDNFNESYHRAKGFIKTGSSSSYVLLGNGDHSLISDLNVYSAKRLVFSRSSVTSADALNNIRNVGLEVFFANGTAVNDSVYGANDGFILSLCTGASWGRQFYFDDESNKSLTRQLNNGTWGSWYEYLHTGNYTTHLNGVYHPYQGDLTVLLKASELRTRRNDDGAGYGLSLYGDVVGDDGRPNYGIHFSLTSSFGTYGQMTGSWATYFRDTDSTNGGWIWTTKKNNANYNVASINPAGHFSCRGNIVAEGSLTEVGTIRHKWASNTNYYCDMVIDSTTWMNFTTNCEKFYFGNPVHVNGDIWLYNKSYGIKNDGYGHFKGLYAGIDGSTTYGGVSLYGQADPMIYGIAFRGSGTYGGLGKVAGNDWATYFTMSDDSRRGWIFRSGSTNYASISARGEGYFSGIGNANYIAFPSGGQYKSMGGNKTGAIAIYFPDDNYGSWGMVMMTIDIYNYSTGTSATYVVGGHNEHNWYNVSAYCLSNSSNSIYGNLTVRFCFVNNKYSIYIGETNTTWSYPQVTIRDITIGYAGEYSKYVSGWSINFVNTIPTPTATIINTRSNHSSYILKYSKSSIVSTTADLNTSPVAGQAEIFFANTTAINNSSISTDGIIINIGAWSANYGNQLFFDDESNKIFMRNINNGTWGSWKEIIHSGNYTNYLGYIGTTPVQSSSAIQNLTGISYLQLKSSGNEQFINFYQDNTIKNQIDSGSTLFEIFSYNSGWRSDLAIVRSTGYVGIGTTSPGYKLDVNGIIKTNNYFKASDGTGFLDIGYWDGVNSRIENEGRPLLITSYSQPIKFGFSGYGNALYLNTNGNIGVNTTAPVYKFDINGDFRATSTVNAESYLNYGSTLYKRDYRFIHDTICFIRQGDSTGTICITLPVSGTSSSCEYDMVVFKITIYEYSSQSVSEITIGGHNWYDYWHGHGYYVNGNYNKGVRLALRSSDNKYCILLGNTSTTWSYVAVYLTDVLTQYSTGWLSKWINEYSISQITSESGYTITNVGFEYGSYFSPSGHEHTYICDSNNTSQHITFSYYAGGYSSNPSYLAAWSGYHITYVPPSYVSVGYASSAGNADTVDNLHKTDLHTIARYRTTGSSSYYKISINSYTYWMLAFTVRIYQSYTYYDIRISGYNYANYYWYSPKASLIDGDGSITVYFGYDSEFHLWICIPGGSYSGIDILDVTNGFYDTGLTERDLFTITAVSSVPSTIQSTQTIYRPLKTNESTSVSVTNSNPSLGKSSSTIATIGSTTITASVGDSDKVDGLHFVVSTPPSSPDSNTIYIVV